MAAALLITAALGVAAPTSEAPLSGDAAVDVHADGHHGDGEHHGEHADHSDDPFHHVRDAHYFELPGHKKLKLPEIGFLPSFNKLAKKWSVQSEGDAAWEKFQRDYERSNGREFSVMGFQLTKFMVLQVVAALLALLVFVPLAIKVRNGDPVRGRFWNFWETVLVFIRDEVVRPTIGDHDAHGHAGDANDHSTDMGQHAEGHFNPGGADELKEANFDLDSAGTSITPGPTAGHPADKFLPLIWSLFIFILFSNLLGAIPLLGTPSGNINVTVVLALVVFGSVLYCGIKQSGPVGFLKSLVPGMEVPGALKPILFPMIWVIEAMGLLIKHCVLAVRLFANLMAGHVVLGVMAGFIGVALVDFLGGGFGDTTLGVGIIGGSLLGQVFVSLLELFVAFMQAYVFAFLATLFIAGAVHPH